MATPTDEVFPPFPVLEESCALCHSIVPGFHHLHCLLHHRWWIPPPDLKSLTLLTGI